MVTIILRMRLVFAVNAETPEFEIKKEIVEPKETYKVGETITYRVSLKNTKS